ncbi:MAG: UDP-N-acetylmuramoyl-tripeptide--D-alanyl-D-alanine ligase [Candidatus Aminicenantes bacterium]|nr:UDP-N-acetylmuramoyl-tripeptide--D-alanyl-D-alanine ligase [Candidatus Aminicenantes bacterium]
MAELSLTRIAEMTGGTIIQGSPGLSFNKFNIDSRLTRPGELFFALEAARNGHDYILRSAQKGAAGAVISRKVPPPNHNFALLKVENTLTALQKIAKKVVREHPVKIVGITGSIGKTTTKEFIYSILKSKYRVHKSEGNFNNYIGLPLSILNLKKEHEITVLEMGMSMPGEIAALTEIAPPDISVITNIQAVHMEFFESLKKIAAAKKEILDGTKKGGTAILNHDDKLVQEIAQGFKGEKIFFGTTKDALIRAEKIKHKELESINFDLCYGKEKTNITLSFFNESYLYNFLAAAATAFSLDVPIDKIKLAAKSLKPFSMRGTIFYLKSKIILIDDSYNSNPYALDRSLHSLAGIKTGRKIAVLGDMREMGKNTENYHLEAGRLVYQLKIDILMTVGKLAEKIAEGAANSGMDKNKIFSFEKPDEAVRKLIPILKDNDIILVKGSRAVEMEKIVEFLKRER